MPYPVTTALFQWSDGERRLRQVEDDRLKRRLESRVGQILDDLRRRLGSTFTVEELADLYGEGTDWTPDVESWVVDAAFNLYAREAKNFAGGRPRAVG